MIKIAIKKTDLKRPTVAAVLITLCERLSLEHVTSISTSGIETKPISTFCANINAILLWDPDQIGWWRVIRVMRIWGRGPLTGLSAVTLVRLLTVFDIRLSLEGAGEAKGLARPCRIRRSCSCSCSGLLPLTANGKLDCAIAAK